jgi:hypothetical protein
MHYFVDNIIEKCECQSSHNAMKKVFDMFIERIGDKFYGNAPEGACKVWHIAQWHASRATRNAYMYDATHFIRDGKHVSFAELIA